ncbi:hypothetical protein AABB24_038281, partial [Solanum stoloniferum]
PLTSTHSSLSLSQIKMGFLKTKGEIYKAVEDVDVGPNSNQFYLTANVKAPRMAGFLVKVFAWLLETPIFGSIMLYFLKRNNLIHKLVTLAELQESPLYVPLHYYEGGKEEENQSVASPREQVRQALGCMVAPKPLYSFSRWTILDYSTAYNSKLVTPTKVMERFLSAVEHSSTPSMQMSFFINFDANDILRQAAQSTHRYQQGEALSVLDGVPIGIKDEIDCMPYPTTGGTKWMHKVRQCKDDAECVKCLRSCGAILVGKTNMHELGAGTSGINPHHGTTRNPYNIGRIAGGSSSGSAAVVAAGLCPAALGVDGGGSVRMPAALCGVVGFKPSFGRVSHSGVLPLNWTVGMVGILAGTVEDALLVYAAISGPNSSHHSQTALQPKLCFPLLKSPKPIPNIRLAKYGEWFNDCNEEIRVCCSRALEKLQDNYGWETIEVTIPEIEVMRLAHYVTIGSECSTSIGRELEKLNKDEVGWDARVALSVYGSFSSQEYLNAQRIRNRQMQFHKRIFSIADVIVTPTTGVTAYNIGNDTRHTGELDYINGAALVRYQIAGNFLGLPAITIPVGYDNSHLPIGLQFIGKPWDESLLIHIAFSMQALCISQYKNPEVYWDLLGN